MNLQLPTNYVSIPDQTSDLSFIKKLSERTYRLSITPVLYIPLWVVYIFITYSVMDGQAIWNLTAISLQAVFCVLISQRCEEFKSLLDSNDPESRSLQPTLSNPNYSWGLHLQKRLKINICFWAVVFTFSLIMNLIVIIGWGPTVRMIPMYIALPVNAYYIYLLKF